MLRLFTRAILGSEICELSDGHLIYRNGCCTYYDTRVREDMRKLVEKYSDGYEGWLMAKQRTQDASAFERNANIHASNAG